MLTNVVYTLACKFRIKSFCVNDSIGAYLMIPPASASNWSHSLNLLMLQINVKGLSSTNQILPFSFFPGTPHLFWKQNVYSLLLTALLKFPGLFTLLQVKLQNHWCALSPLALSDLSGSGIFTFNLLASDIRPWESPWQTTTHIFTQKFYLLCCLLKHPPPERWRGSFSRFSKLCSTHCHWNL